ncbi:hypothetical protein ACFOWV_10625 [Vreelandella malpeensis]|uniref:hypothetical protein n=1 Tax=Vreelandella malpeensis TaxID=1172368 RepID=UPI0036209A1E
MLVGACGRRLGDPVSAFAGKRRVVKKRDEADKKNRFHPACCSLPWQCHGEASVVASNRAGATSEALSPSFVTSHTTTRPKFLECYSIPAHQASPR